MSALINPLALNNRTIMVTGASSGIGRETAVLLSKLGAQVILVARNQPRLEETASQLQGIGHHIESFDLNATGQIPGWLKSVTTTTGSLHGLVHCAGIQITAPLRYLKAKQLNAVMKINFEAAVALAKGFRQKRVFAPNSSIVFLASVMGLVGQPGVSAYAASKGALIALSKSLALELARDGIRVNCIAAAHVRTEMAKDLKKTLTSEQIAEIEAMHPLGIGHAIDVANAIAFLLADTSRWITGTTFVVDGGYTAH